SATLRPRARAIASGSIRRPGIASRSLGSSRGPSPIAAPSFRIASAFAAICAQSSAAAGALSIQRRWHHISAPALRAGRTEIIGDAVEPAFASVPVAPDEGGRPAQLDLLGCGHVGPELCGRVRGWFADAPSSPCRAYLVWRSAEQRQRGLRTEPPVFVVKDRD